MKSLSEFELINESKSNLHVFENGIRQKKYTLEEISQIIPGIVHVNSINSFALKFMNKYGEDRYNISLEELLTLGDEFINSVFEPDTVEIFTKPVRQLLAEGDDSKAVTYFQKVKVNQNDSEWLLTSTKVLKGKDELISISQSLSCLDRSSHSITKLLDDNLFLRKNIRKFGALTNREKQILKLVANGLSTKKVAEELFLSPQTVKTHRKNICKKLDLKKCIDWEYFANTFDI